MFLDEELEKAYNGGASVTQLILTCLDRVKQAENELITLYLATIKRTENSWRLFCKRHTQFDSNGFRNFMIKEVGVPDSVRKYLHW